MALGVSWRCINAGSPDFVDRPFNCKFTSGEEDVRTGMALVYDEFGGGCLALLCSGSDRDRLKGPYLLTMVIWILIWNSQA